MSDTERTEFELPPGVGPGAAPGGQGFAQNADLDPQRSAGESDIDTSLRPKSLDEFIGQPKVRTSWTWCWAARAPAG